MAMPSLRSPLPGDADGDVVALEARRVEAARRSIRDRVVEVAEIRAHNDRDQLTRDIADIERATEALLKGEPALRPASDPAVQAGETAPVSKASPIWVLVSALWLSTAIIAAGAVVAVVTIVG